MAELQRACFLNHFPGEPPAGSSRLYFGAEFCFWRLPSVQQILAARDWASTAGWHFTLVLPVLGESEYQKLKDLLARTLPRLAAGDEVLISDWGALELVRSVRDDLVVILGRALSAQKRGPRILDLDLNREQIHYFQQSSWHNREAVEFLREQDINRVEQDNLLQGLAPLPAGLTGSLHIPYAMVTSGRNCPFRQPGDSGRCPVSCGEVFSLSSAETSQLLYQDGNTQFLYHEQLPENLPALGIDRVVMHPRWG